MVENTKIDASEPFQEPPKTDEKKLPQTGKSDRFSATIPPDNKKTKSSQIAEEILPNIKSSSFERLITEKSTEELHHDLNVILQRLDSSLEKLDSLKLQLSKHPENSEVEMELEQVVQEIKSLNIESETHKKAIEIIQEPKEESELPPLEKAVAEHEKHVTGNAAAKRKSVISSLMLRAAILDSSAPKVQIIKQYAEKKLAERKPEQEFVSDKFLGNTVLISSKKSKKTGETKIEYIDIASKKAIGSGSYGTVWKVNKYSIQGNRIQIKKTAVKSTHEAKGKADILNEKKILAHLNRNGRAKGIQKPGKVYDGCLCKFDEDTEQFKFTHRISKENKIDAFYQLACGLEKCEKDGIMHGDIKGENILIKQEKDGTVTCDIADFGGAQSYDKLEKELQDTKKIAKPAGTFTPPYLTSNDKTLLLRHVNNQKFDQYKAVSKNINIFALGRTMYEVFTKQTELPFEKENEMFPVFKSTYDLFRNEVKKDLENYSDCPFVLRDLIADMLHPDQSKRPPEAEIRKRLGEFIANTPELSHLAKKHDLVHA